MYRKGSQSAADRTLAEKLVTRADTLRKQVVATTEGGAITGEERLRELTDTAYGAITSSEAAPTPYQMARVNALERELGDVERGFGTLQAGELQVLNRALQRSGKPTINAAAVAFDVDQARGGPLDVLARGLLGMRFTGTVGSLLGLNEKDRLPARGTEVTSQRWLRLGAAFFHVLDRTAEDLAAGGKFQPA